MFKYVKSTYGILQHSAQWFNLEFNDQDIYLTDKAKSKTETPPTDDSDTAVYFIHGTADQSCSFNTIASRLKEYGLNKNITSMHLVSFTGRYQGYGIEDFAKQLFNKIQDNGHKRVILCGHSRGAIIAAYFNEFIARKEGIDVEICISIGGPFRGSYLAVRPLGYFSNSVDQMSKDSPFLKELRSSINLKPNSPYLFIIGGQDCVVPNRSGYILEYVAKHPDALYMLEDHGHVSIMTSTTLSKYLQEKLNHVVEEMTDERSLTIIK